MKTRRRCDVESRRESSPAADSERERERKRERKRERDREREREKGRRVWYLVCR